MQQSNCDEYLKWQQKNVLKYLMHKIIKDNLFNLEELRLCNQINSEVSVFFLGILINKFIQSFVTFFP